MHGLSGASMEEREPRIPGSPFRILAVTQALWGERIARNVRERAPADWQVKIWTAPSPIPPIVDDPDDYLPPELPQADLLLALGEVPGLAQLIPDIVRRCGAPAVIAPIDRNESLPPGLMRQVKHWLDEMGVASVFPKPFCSLTEETINGKPILAGYDNPHIRRFAQLFGRPRLRLAVAGGRITEAEVLRDSACGCARSVASGLVGIPVDEALERAGLLHHHYPCLANMNIDPDYHDTLMHVSGNILKDEIKEALGTHLTIEYVRPLGYSDEGD